MYSKILVPLDGSELAERALPPAQSLARSFNATVYLFQAVSRYEELEAWRTGVDNTQLAEYSQDIAERIIAAQETRAQSYLQQKANELQASGVSTVTETRKGPAADRIIQYAEEQGIDLIVISTHGYGGIKRLLLGSVTDRVIRSAHVPVHVVPP